MPDEKEKPKSKGREILNKILKIGDAVGSAARLVSKIVSIFNSRSIYEANGDVTPAANPNREMNPVACKPFTNNGTASVIRFVDTDVKWVDFADSYAVSEAALSLYEILRGKYKGNTPYSVRLIQELLVNTLFVSVGLLQLCRDVAWRQHPLTEVIGFKELALLRANTSQPNYYGFVPLELPSHLRDEEIVGTLQSLQAILTDASRLSIPSRLFDFIHHYFGELFIIDYDSFNDQYARLIMHEMDFYDYANDTYVKRSVNDMSLDDYAALVHELRLRYVTVLADIADTSSNWRPITELVTHLFDVNTMTTKSPNPVYDKTFEQALTNAYTEGSNRIRARVFNGDYIRLDYFADIEDELTTYMFLGGIITEDEMNNTYKMAKPLTVVRQVAKFDSDEDLSWPTLMQGPEAAFAGVQRFSGPFGYAFTSTPQVIQYDVKREKIEVEPGSEQDSTTVTFTGVQIPTDGTTVSTASVHGGDIYFSLIYDCDQWKAETAESREFVTNLNAYKFYGVGSLIVEGSSAQALQPDHVISGTDVVVVRCPMVYMYCTIAQVNTRYEASLANVVLDFELDASVWSGKTVKEAIRAINTALLRVSRHIGYTSRNASPDNIPTLIMQEIFTDNQPIYTAFTNSIVMTHVDGDIDDILVGHISTNKAGGKLIGWVNFIYELEVNDLQSSIAHLTYNYSTISNNPSYIALFGHQTCMGFAILVAHNLGYMNYAWFDAVVENYTSSDDPVSIESYNVLSTLRGIGVSNFITNLTKYHVPLMIDYASAQQNDGGPEVNITFGTPELVKPDFIPFFYGTADLYSVMLKMIGSLFKTDRREKE